MATKVDDEKAAPANDPAAPPSTSPADTHDTHGEKAETPAESKQPKGGFDATPIPPARDGFTLKFTFHRAENLPMADLRAGSSDPYISATLTSHGITKRHREDPDLVLRTKTVHRSTEPVWEQTWVVAGVPSSGFRLKCRLYDEDPSDHDDRLGNVTFEVRGISADWPGIKEEEFDIKKRMGSKRAYFLAGCVSLFDRKHEVTGRLVLSVEMLGPSDPPHGRMYTVGPMWWTKHQSALIGRLAGTKAPENDHEPHQDGEQRVERYNFQANQIQLEGPVPPELYHRYVEFKPFVKGMFSSTGPRGYVLNKLLHHQHHRIYSYSPETEWGMVPPGTDEATRQFLRMVHFDEGSRIFTYVVTLDGLMRFTETGKEFSIDLLSKHTMHSNVDIYIACSGEFFVRRLKHPNRDLEDPGQVTHPPDDVPGGPPDSPPPEDPTRYELVIDNDSGTYRPNGAVLPQLKTLLQHNFPGLKVSIKECTDDHLQKMKAEQRERRKQETKGGRYYVQASISSSDDDRHPDDLDSSDASDLDDAERRGIHRSKRQVAYDAVENPKSLVRDLLHGGASAPKHKEKEKEQPAPPPAAAAAAS